MTEIMPSPAWNQTDREYPDRLIHEAFSDQVARTPSAPAVRFRDEALTYMELDRRVEALALHLVGLGVKPGSFVAMCLDRSIEMVVAVHAILRAGGAFIPLDPEYPDERIEFMLEELDGPVLLTQERSARRFVETRAQVVSIDAPFDPPSGPAATVFPRVSPDDLAYIIYTSGSTGQPKGAMNTHRGIANRVYWMQDHIPLTQTDKVLQKTPYSFDVSVPEFLSPLIHGAELVVAEPGGHRDSAYLVRTIVEHGVTTIHFVPSMLQLFLEDPRVGDCVSLRRVFCSGEALPRAVQDRFFDRLPCELHNLYGPTEAAVEVSYWVCEPASPLPFVPIGKPVANTQLHILDADLRPVPVGHVGELHIGGVQVASGYLKRPELTAERFVPDPFRIDGKLYKTGDLARYLPDGNIEFLGRSDFQVKIRGFRVELGEIETTLESVDGVRGAVVVAHERPSGDVELVAYVAHPDAGRLSIDGLRSRLGERLPEYMVPTTIMALDQFPLNANGKVDRKALPMPVRTRPQLETPFVSPRSPLEHLLADKWRGILDLDRVGVHDRFFELGGTSLQATRFVNQIQTELGETIFVVTLFGAPSVAEYAAFLERQFPLAVARLVGTSPPQESSVLVPASNELRAQDRRPARSRDQLAQQLDRRRGRRSGVGG